MRQLRNEIKVLNERNTRLHRRCQLAEAKAKRQYDHRIMAMAAKLRIAEFYTQAYQLQLEQARADAAEARLEEVLDRANRQP